MTKKSVFARTLVSLLLGTAISASALAAAENTGHTLRLAIGAEPTEGFDPMLGWSTAVTYYCTARCSNKRPIFPGTAICWTVTTTMPTAKSGR